MNIRILCLNILYLMGTCYTAAIPQIFLPLIKKKTHRRANDYYLLCCCGVYIFLIFMSIMVIDNFEVEFSLPSIWWIGIIIAAPAVIIAMEYLIGIIALMFEGKKAKGFSVNTNWKGCSAIGFVATLMIGTLEEIMYREVWADIILYNMSLSIGLFCVLSSCFYAMNHIYFGYTVFVQKLFTGIILSALYIISGYCITVPVTIHILQNLAILLVGRRKT